MIFDFTLIRIAINPIVHWAGTVVSFTLDLLEYCAGEGCLVQPQGAPHLYEGREDHPEGEGPHREDHQQDVQPGVDVVIAAVVGDQNISVRKKM